MHTISRICANKIITRALRYDGRALIATLNPDAEDCEVCESSEQLAQNLLDNPGAAIVHNQDPEAIDQVKSIETSEDQLFIEIRQDTKGVLGLFPWQRDNNQLETLQLSD